MPGYGLNRPHLKNKRLTTRSPRTWWAPRGREAGRAMSSRTGRAPDGEGLAQTRERFLTREPVEPHNVRSPILASWWRSRQWNVPADHIELSYIRDPDLDTLLTRSAMPVLRHL